MRLANGIVIDKEATFGTLKFSALRREFTSRMRTEPCRKKSRNAPMI